MAVAQAQSTSKEPEVRTAIETALTAMGGETVENDTGRLVIDLGGSVKSAYLAGPFRNKWKMPVRVVVTTSGGSDWTEVYVDVHSRGTASGRMSGGAIGAFKQSKAEQSWLAMAVEAVPRKVAPPPTTS